MLTMTTRQAYSELDSLLELLNEEDRNKIPSHLREYFKREKDANYTKDIKIDIPISEQNLKKETLNLIALLDMQYWSDEARKKELEQYYKGKNKKYSDELQEQLKNLNNRHTSMEDIEISQAMPCVSESLWQRVINKIKKLFKR